MIVTKSSVKQWGNGLGVRLTQAVAKTAGIKAGSVVRIAARPGRIVVETSDQVPTLNEMLALFDPKRHGGEVMALDSIGRDIL
jgi:antitoxin MazE